jgi:predicted ribosome quality control (RQC) complex YloA/Tae2 family protein
MGIQGSLHQHYGMIKALSDELRQKLMGYLLTDVYTLSKEELVLVFSSMERVFTIKVVQQYQTCFLFFDDSLPEKISNAQPCFEGCLNQPVLTVHQHLFNRSFALEFPDRKQIVFKLYDGLVNLLMFEGDVVVDLFRKNITNDWELKGSAFEGKNPQEMIANEGFYLYERTDIHPYYLTFSSQSDTLLLHTHSALEAYNRFSKLCLNHYRFFYLKQQLVNQTLHQIAQTKVHLNDLEKAMQDRNNRISDEETANIIMANLQQIPPKVMNVELFDFYRNQPVRIKLKKELNAQQNAAYYYRKAKNNGIELAKQQEHRERMEAKLKALEATLNKQEVALSYRDLKSFVKESTPKEKQIPFRKFASNGYDIWVGKSAANNDELTQRFSHKNDLWLHAKDVTGSHVLIKWKPGKPFPNEVITAAAQLAAYYSKLKGSGLVPVIYTPKKFVRKPKGAEPGSVVVDKEEVIMVVPKLIP